MTSVLTSLSRLALLSSGESGLQELRSKAQVMMAMMDFMMVVMGYNNGLKNKIRKRAGLRVSPPRQPARLRILFFNPLL